MGFAIIVLSFGTISWFALNCCSVNRLNAFRPTIPSSFEVTASTENTIDDVESVSRLRDASDKTGDSDEALSLENEISTSGEYIFLIF